MWSVLGWWYRPTRRLLAAALDSGRATLRRCGRVILVFFGSSTMRLQPHSAITVADLVPHIELDLHVKDIRECSGCEGLRTGYIRKGGVQWDVM